MLQKLIRWFFGLALVGMVGTATTGCAAYCKVKGAITVTQVPPAEDPER